MDVQRDHLVLPNRKNPNLTVKRVYLPAGQADLPGALLVWANEHGLRPQAPLFFSRKHGAEAAEGDQSRASLDHSQGSLRMGDVHVLALRASHHGAAGTGTGPSSPFPPRACAADRPHDAQFSVGPASGGMEPVEWHIYGRRRGGAPAHAGRPRMSRAKPTTRVGDP